MTRKPDDAERQKQIDDLLRRAHRESLEGPERTPFWREGTWRCELHVRGEGPRLKVFDGSTCVHEEATEPGRTADERAHELRTRFASRRRD